VVLVLGLLHETGNESTNPHFNLENSPRAQFQALQQKVRARERCFNETTNLLTIVILLLSRQFDHYWSW